MALPIYQGVARSILTPVSGYIREAGFTHSLSPARNCTYGCTYCYVPTLGLYGGLRPEDVARWGQFTTFKENAAALLWKEIRPGQIIYCSPLVDPYQPAEAQEEMMPRVLAVVAERPPAVFVIQTRGPLILRDLTLLQQAAQSTVLRVSFSVTTNREDVRRWYEPHCAPIAERLRVIQELRAAGIEVYATLAPLLPSDIPELISLAIAATGRDVIGDPLHVRQTKRAGATTRPAAWAVAITQGHAEWFAPAFQEKRVQEAQQVAQAQGREFVAGPAGFSLLTRV